MKKLYFLLFTFAFVSLNAQDVNITFQVNMNEESGFLATDSVWVVYSDDGNWGFVDYDPMSDADADGNYTFTLTVDGGGAEVVQQYSFAYGPNSVEYTDWETPPEECRNANWYREVTVAAGVTDITLPAYYYGLCTDDISGNVDVTFQVDMTGISDIQGAVWTNINGDWTDWFDMTDAGSNIYTVTKSYTPGDIIYYIFSYQNGPSYDYDYFDETVPASCGGTFGVRRYVVKATGNTIPVVLFGACPAEDPELVEITFNVDMSNETIDGKQVWQVIKSPWYWNELSAAGDGIYTGKVVAHKGQTFPYSFLLGAQDEWSGEESVPAECNHGTPTAPERLFEGSEKDSIMPTIVFGQCLDVSDKYAITFRVDMTDVSDIYANGYVWVNIDDWTDWYDMTDDDEDGIYEYTAQLSEAEVINYIFSYQNGPSSSNDYVDETVPSGCATEGQRVYTVGTADEVLDLVKFGACWATRVDDFTGAELKLYPNPVREQLTIELPDVSSGKLSIIDLSGREVISREFSNCSRIECSVEQLVPEIYFISVVTETQTLQGKVLVK